GLTFPAGNVIAFNEATGIRVASPQVYVRNRISRNAIYSNGLGPDGGLGIDLEPLGVTANDFCDPDNGPNNLQNFPVITSVSPAHGGGISIVGSINSVPGNYRIEFFDSSNCDPSGFGEGARFLGSTTATVQFPFCEASFVATIGSIHFGQAD